MMNRCPEHDPLIGMVKDIKGMVLDIRDALQGELTGETPGLISRVCSQGKRIDTLEKGVTTRGARVWDVMKALLPWAAVILLYAVTAWHKQLGP